MKIAEKIQEKPSAHKRDSCIREVCRRGNDELGAIFTEPVLDISCGSTRHRYGVPLFLVVASNCINNVERNIGCTIFGYTRQVALGHQV
jgi:hypothetical protein